MTDGPFRNSELSSRWKRYGEELVSDATSLEERRNHACHSMMGDVDMPSFNPLIQELKAYVERPQLDLEPVVEVEAIFERHSSSPLADTLQRNLIANLRDQYAPHTALATALDCTGREWIGITKNRIEEECIRARDLGDMNPGSYQRAIERSRQAFASITLSELSSALATGDRQAFAKKVRKQLDVDAGPAS